MPKKSRPNHSPKKTSQWVVDKIIDIKKEKPEIGSAKLENQIIEFVPIECMDCDFDQYIPIQYYLVNPEVETEEQDNELKKLVKKSIGFSTPLTQI